MMRREWFYAIVVIMIMMSGADAEGDCSTVGKIIRFMLHSLRSLANIVSTLAVGVNCQGADYVRINPHCGPPYRSPLSPQTPRGSTAFITQRST